MFYTIKIPIVLILCSILLWTIVLYGHICFLSQDKYFAYLQINQKLVFMIIFCRPAIINVIFKGYFIICWLWGFLI